MVERLVRNEKVRGSIPLNSTIPFPLCFVGFRLISLGTFVAGSFFICGLLTEFLEA